MRKKQKRPIHIAEIVSRTTQRFGMEEKLALYRVWDKWEDVIGPQIATHAKPARLCRGVLVIRVENPSWLQELHFLKARIMDKLKEVFKDKEIRGIRLELGEIPELPAPIANRGGQRQSRNLKPQEMEFIKQVTGEIADPQVREAALSAMTTGFQRGRRTA